MTEESNSDVAVELPIRHRRGDDFERIFEFYDDADFTIPTNIQDREFFIDIVDCDGNVIKSFNLNDGLELVEDEIHQLNWSWSADDQDELDVKADIYRYDLQQVIDGKAITTHYGPFTLTDDQTKRRS